ncbi:MAG: MBL fold metallo-hydrolase [Deltaproteobacteria bacterium]|nr:MBL fold metallo-hydrolase [Deltaproteobacteria bacterium]
MTERELESLGIWRIPVPIPFVQAGGPVNVYLIEEEDGGLALFDSGLGSAEARAALAEGFRRLGRSPADLRRIVISHGHVDHYGNAQNLVEEAGHPVAVHAHAADVGKVASHGQRWRDKMGHYGAYLVRLGVPPEVLMQLAGELGGGYDMARRVNEVHAIAEGARLRFRRFEAEVLHMPGHTSGLICLWVASHGLLLAADHLLERVSPNPIIELGPEGEEGFFRPLVSYLSSIARTRELPVQLVLPGHGPPFSGHARVIDALLGFYGKRQERIRELLAGGPRTAYEVTVGLFPRTRPGDLFLTISESIANLEVMEGRGELLREAEPEPYRFRLAA